MQSLLVIDDEPSICKAFERAFSSDTISVLTAKDGAEGERLFTDAKPDVVVIDLSLPDVSGLELFKRLRELDARVPFIFITGHGTVQSAIEATKLGAYDYLFKPLELDEIRTLLDKAFKLSRMVRVQPVLAESDAEKESTGDAIVGRCNAMKEVYKAIGRVASQNLTVLLLGESGTGKEVVAQAIYHHSARSTGPFQAINCAAIPDALLESEIFGHEKGAFTDAHRQRIGKLQQADGGTLFLDEVGDMSPMTQAKLLRVLQDQTFERVGGNTPIQVDVRIIAATNHDLKQLVSEGLFRSDLYFRLSVVTIQLPPLREREDDLRVLAEYFLRRYSNEFGKDIRTIAPETLEVLGAYHWPGNVRELESVMKQSLLTARGNVLLPDFLPPLGDVRGHAGDSSGPEFLSEKFVVERLEAGTDNLYAEAISIAERQLFRQVLTHTAGNQLKAATLLGISRVTLRSKLKSLGIEAADFAN
ncbi:Response regulator of zinc sigma-54-dependent two-component system [Rhodopirellula islandica]|uniref:DNA-binding transcriptional regulator NtrC n=1 Tax=Rhodopirellula islandica TaxID=595434 RepID=A0A0J1BLV8_RHOIS|nr:sigma-54 dependent transcriptional regulator [Rhodopirellula islandica]KLU07521.1 Response regulator of zinc sigma-54-dependent two-component system [Rhodopirellula islandica]